ncbi:MAG: hypothetical protein AAF990_08455 [Bacteroidota bacterium]
MLRTILFLVLLMSLSNCSISKRVKAHEKLLAATAQSDAEPPEKLDVLATSLVQMMHEGLQFVNPKKGLKFVERYGEANQESIYKILDEVGEWQDGLNTLQTIAYSASLLTKPYARDLIDLFPKFKRKYDQIVFVYNLNRKLQGTLSDWGLKK